MLVNNAGRSIRRSVALSYDRFHDYERTVQLNYLSPVKLMLGLLPHMRDQGGGHIVNVSSIGVQTNPPRFSAYVGSKAALDAFTRVVSSETIGDNVTFTTIHMPLVRTPMIAPTKMYDSFPTISPEEAADLVCEAIRAKPKQINTQLGTFGEVAYALAPKAVDQILHLAYKVFPESAAAQGREGRPDEKASRRGDGAGVPDEGRALVTWYGIPGHPLRASAFLMIVTDQPPELSPDDEADLVAYVDGSLDPQARRASRRALPTIPPSPRRWPTSARAATRSTPRRRAPAPRSRSGPGSRERRRRDAAMGTAGRPHAPGSGGSDGRVPGWWPARSPPYSPRSCCSAAAARASTTWRPRPCASRPPRSPPSHRTPSCWRSGSPTSRSPTTSRSSAGRR